MLRRAIPLMCGDAESIYEGLLRMVHIVCDVAVRPQFVVTDEAGRFVARADLHLTGTQRLAEYDGDDHLTRDRYRRDLRRTGRIADAGYERRGYTMTTSSTVLSACSATRTAHRAANTTPSASRRGTHSCGAALHSLRTAPVAGQARPR